ncbi:MAG: GWxTD domain-containing protein [Polaribacter sp.]|jgi:GWxTD domain-containing protein
MKRLLLALCFITISHFAVQALDASVAYATFKSPPNKSFVEVYLNIMGTTVNHKHLDSFTQQGAVEVLIMIKKEDVIVSFEKYILNGPVSQHPLDFMDVRRIGLDDGLYQLEVEIRDMNDSTNLASYDGKFEIAYQKETLLQSDLQLIRSLKPTADNSSFVKSGYHMEPLPYNFYYKTDSVLIFYQELYNSDKAFTEKFLLKYVVEKIKGNNELEPVLLGHKKLDPKPVNVILIRKDISKLESGRYKLTVEVKNRQGDVLSSRETQFDRSNPYRDTEILLEKPIEEVFVAKLDSAELRYSLKAIAAHVGAGSVRVLNNIIREGTAETQRRYLYSFWIQMDRNPEAAYTRYMEVARAVDKTYYSGFGHGFESDRGRIFMKYGKPNDVVTVENETAAPPYEIWFYARVPSSPPQSDVKFIFYNPTYAVGSFEMLHSTCRGELENPQWEVELYRGDRQATGGLDGDATTFPRGGINKRAREFWEGL